MDRHLTRELERARHAVAPLARRLDRDALSRLRPLAWHEALAKLPVLHLDDVSAIPFLVDVEGVEEYQHRARLRARDGDSFAAVTAPNEAYEAYCREHLGLGAVDVVLAPVGPNPLAVADACSRGAPFECIAARARRAGGLVLHPYMGIEAVWELGRRLGERIGTTVAVLAPPPPITWIANDKAAFGELVSLVLGPRYLVESRSSATVEGLAEGLAGLAARHRRVALKRLRCASAMGNMVFESEALVASGRPAIEAEVRAFLDRTEWDRREEVLAVAWEETRLSPSTQLWIPPTGSGAPRLDGIYEQILKGSRGIFVGSRPSTLPERVNRDLASASLRAAAGLQALGYVGRCSFDFLVVGDPEGDYALRFTECNGRWGGTSTPMALLDRLLGRPPDGPFAPRRRPYRAQDLVHPGLVGTRFSELLEPVGEEAFDPATGRGRYLFYNVGPLERFGKLDVIALGRSQQEAEAALEEDLPRLLGLG